MARKSKSQRVHEILVLNPALRRDDPRISELINAEAMLRKAQRAATNAPLTVTSAAGTAKRSPEWVAVDSVNTMVRRLRQDIGIDRLSVKRSEAAGVKAKRSNDADTLLALFRVDYLETKELIPGQAAFLAAHGILADDMPEHTREAFKADLLDQANHVPGITQRLKA
ncbi:hypothetical protein PQR66_03285 [Paraburkholderia agricolaris]|uniref:Uncharacterized protein n=1 Tax=Paraburkholderia agricolaris TaxID=2152888 RepID=A0ABW8ZIP5_9BURK